MSNFQLFEISCIVLIIGIQCFIFISVFIRVRIFSAIFPEVENFRIRGIKLKPEFAAIHPKDILTNLDKYLTESEPKIIIEEIITDGGTIIRPAEYEMDTRISIDIITCEISSNAVTNNICYSLNTYLIRNKGIAADFHLIKDVVERNTDAKEIEINQTISLPLYLGLLGTFIGIVIGLIQISGVDFSGDPKALDGAISILLKGVMIAMIASFAGLLLTIINTGYFFKRAKSKVEDLKNDFYTFIQTDLLPLLNQNINSTLYSLQNNLHKFNEEFKTNVTGLSAIMGKNHDALVAQEKILTVLDNIDITQFAKANVIILKELKLSTEKFSEFNKYLGLVNQFILTTNGYSNTVNQLIENTHDLQSVGKNIIKIFEENKTLNEFLQNHYSALDESHQLITTSVNSVNKTFNTSLDQLKDFTQEKIIEVQKVVSKQFDLLQKESDLMKEVYPEKWKKLDNLSYLETVSKNLSDVKMSSASQLGSLKSEVEAVVGKLSDALATLDIIKKNTSSPVTEKIKGSFKRLFGKRTKVSENV